MANTGTTHDGNLITLAKDDGNGNYTPHTPPSEAWKPKGDPFTKSFSKNGRSNIGLGTIDTKHQVMSGQLDLTPFKFEGKSDTWDYFLLSGMFRHGVQNGGKNALCVGYYATKMVLRAFYKKNDMPNGDAIFDYGPGSTVGMATTGFTVGGGLTADSSGGGGEVNGAFAVSFASPSVKFGASSGTNLISWRCDLPGVGFQSPGVPANPQTPSSAGYLWYPALIVKCPKGVSPKLDISVDVEWEFDYTRGIANDHVRWTDNWELDIQS